MQSYQNVSNSQHCIFKFLFLSSCKRLCKVIKMLAIHNQLLLNHHWLLVANAYAKLSKCQQFTTIVTELLQMLQLQTLMQSYQNVSNSQPKISILYVSISCKRLCKVIKMLAIHNIVLPNLSFIELQTLMQSYQNVSNSQHSAEFINDYAGCKRLCKVIKMLAIHNDSF